MGGNEGFGMALVIALKRMDIVCELLKRDPKAPLSKVMADAEKVAAWAFSGAKGDLPDGS